MTRKPQFYLSLGIVSILLCTLLHSCIEQDLPAPNRKPNVILIMTDDQGIGDFGFTGNPYIRTPHLDNLASRSLNLTNFHVSPVCAPTRACLMTGRYSERTGVYDTYNGGAIMSTEEITIAEILKENGYRTGIFGKWHLGDNYPYRPIDQGFDVAVVHRAGGVGQPGDVYNFFAGDSSYFNPVLFKNGIPLKTEGYCSDVYTDELIGFIESHQENKDDRPFFTYLSFNAPHTPLQLPEEYYDIYKDMEFETGEFGIYDEAVEKMSARDIEDARKVYGMVTNIDDNIGKLIRILEETGLSNNTIIIFLTDNGPQQHRYRMGFRGRKSSVFNGGIRVPCLIHVPGRYTEKSDLDAPIAHFDLLPSILDLCGIQAPGHRIDGQSIFSPVNEGYTSFLDRIMFFEWGRGYLVKYRNFAAMKGEFKLVGNTGQESGIEDFELFNMNLDPQEKNNILSENLELAQSLKAEIDNWYDEIIREKNNTIGFPAYIGTPHENPVILNRNDAKGTPVAWRGENILNYWEVRAEEDAVYDITCHFVEPLDQPGRLTLKMYPYHFEKSTDLSGLGECTIKEVEIKKGDYQLWPYYQTRNSELIFPLYVSVKRVD